MGVVRTYVPRLESESRRGTTMDPVLAPLYLREEKGLLSQKVLIVDLTGYKSSTLCESSMICWFSLYVHT